MDDLTYFYTGNQLKAVDDDIASSATQGFIDGVELATEYTYDANGNMTSDANKGITGIIYNHLNLPKQVNINNGFIQYIYAADGLKLKKQVSTTGTETLYAGNHVYGGSIGHAQLQFFSTPEGYVEPKDPNNLSLGYDYVYQYKDHLGNIRLSYKNVGTASVVDLEIQEENNYYPFGLKHKGYNNVVNSTNVAQDFKYNGVEFENALGLDLYEMDFRQYDPAIARFTSIDPVTQYYQSTYTAFDDNPIFYADPSGTTSTAEWMEKNGISQSDVTTIYQAEDNSEESNSNNSNGPNNDITVNAKGKVTKVVENDKPHKVFDENGNEVALNDYDFDSQWLDGVRKDDQLYTKIDFTFIARLINKAGVDKYYRLNGNYARLFYDSYSGADFGVNQLRDEFNMFNTEYDGNVNGNGAFFRVAGQSTMYNFADFGQFLWGGWMRANTFTKFESKAGAQINNLIFGYGIFDSTADQQAIGNGHDYISNILKNAKK